MIWSRVQSVQFQEVFNIQQWKMAKYFHCGDSHCLDSLLQQGAQQTEHS